MLIVKESQIQGKGLFTSEPIKKGAKITIVADMLYHCPTRDNWITHNGRMVNHQKECNTELIFNGRYYWLHATKDIEPDEELTSDYTKLKYPFCNKVNGYIENK